MFDCFLQNRNFIGVVYVMRGVRLKSTYPVATGLYYQRAKPLTFTSDI